MDTFFSSLIARLKAWLQAAKHWIVAERMLIIAAAVGVSVAGAGVAVYWYRDILRSDIQHVLRIPAPFVTAKSPPADVMQQLAALEARVDSLTKQYQADAAYREQLTNDFQSAMKEVSANNDALVKQGKQLSEALQHIQASDTTIANGAITSQSSDSPPAPSATSKVNINTATAAELDALPGIGPSYAAAIVTYRTQHGPFKTIQDITNVAGIGDATFQKLQDLITV